METPRTRYSDEELEEFRAVILRKFETARRLFDELRESKLSTYGASTAFSPIRQPVKLKVKAPITFL